MKNLMKNTCLLFAFAIFATPLFADGLSREEVDAAIRASFEKLQNEAQCEDTLPKANSSATQSVWAAASRSRKPMRSAG